MHSIRSWFLLTVCALFLPLTVACEGSTDDADTVIPADTVTTAEAPPPEIAAARDDFGAAWSEDDPAAVAAFFSEDATATPGDSTYSGRAEIERGWLDPTVPARADARLTSISTEQMGDDWRDEGTYAVMRTTPEGEATPEEGRYTIIWTRGVAGDWQIRSIDVQAIEAR